MFGLLGSSQIYGLQQVHEYGNNNNNRANSDNNISNNNRNEQTNNSSSHKQRRSATTHTESGSKFFASLSSMQQGIRSPTNFIEKFIKNELLSGYDSIKNYKNFQNSNNSSGSNSTFFTAASNERAATPGCVGGGGGEGGDSLNAERLLTTFNCLQGSYRSNCDGEFYEPVNVTAQRKQATTVTTHAATRISAEADMTVKYSKNLLANTPDEQSPATLQNYQKLSECEQDLLLTPSSGASSGEFNSDANGSGSGSGSGQATTPVNSLYKRLSFGGRGGKGATDNAAATVAINENVSDYSSSNNSSASSTLSSKATSLSLKSIDLQRTSSASSSGDCAPLCERRKSSPIGSTAELSAATVTDGTSALQPTPERVQRRKLIAMISHYEQQTKLLQRELAKEQRRRGEELACVAKSLLCFESKLKKDMKAVNHRLFEKDVEICRLVQQNRALRKRLLKYTEAEGENARDEGVVEDGEPGTEGEVEEERNGKTKEAVVERRTASPATCSDPQLLEDCLVLEALQCINCKKQFYDIDLNEGWTQNTTKDGTRKSVDHTTEHGSSSDDTVSSSFYGARRSVRYTSKRTSGTFRDYMRSRAMNIDDPSLDNNSEENTSTISRDDSQTSYEKLNMYSRTIERMHGVKGESERESEQSGMEGTVRPASRLSCKSSGSSKSSNSSCSKLSAKATTPQIEEDDGIFSPTQDEDFEEPEEVGGRSIKIVMRRSTEFSEASPKQVYETSTDDWYASASDQEEITTTTVVAKSYANGAVNPVLECVNQILLQQSMEEPVAERNNQTTVNVVQSLQVSYSNATATANLPRRSSLSGRRSSRSNSRSSDGQPSRNGTLTRKRVHFSTKNSMVHVPRNDEHDEEDEDVNDDDTTQDTQDTNEAMISSLAQYHPMSYYPQAAQQAATAKAAAAAGTIARGGMLAEVSEHERLETLNYESIYSNEYEPIGSEHNSSNLYVDMESATKSAAINVPSTTAVVDIKVPKTPPALPPKPANLLKFKKSLQQLDELPDEHLHQEAHTTVEPDYCSISEVNMGITSVQIVADVHKVPESEADLESNSALEAPISELDVEVSTVASDETFAVSQKTDEIEEIFADVPKLPNVAAIIAPKQANIPKQQSTLKRNLPSADYLIMSPKVETSNMKLQSARNATILNTASATKQQINCISANNNIEGTTKAIAKPSADYLNTPLKSPNRPDTSALKLHLHTPSPLQYKRKHMPNILAEINKRMSLPSSPTTPTARLTFATPTKPVIASKSPLQQGVSTPPNMPMQAEFDWYNLDAEYGKTATQQPELHKVSDSLNNGTMLAGIHEDGESLATAADEYNLDEEFSLASDKPDEMMADNSEQDNESAEEKSEISVVDTTKPLPTNIKLSTQRVEHTKIESVTALNAAICEAVNFPMFGESSPLVALSPAIAHHHAKAKKIKKNLANFEKFIEGSGLSTKPLPSKRKIYFAGPFV